MNHKFRGVENRLDAIEENIESLRLRSAPHTEVVVVTSAQPRIPDKTYQCRRTTVQFVRMAELAAPKNMPAGNRVQGEALEYYNQEMDEYRNCN